MHVYIIEVKWINVIIPLLILNIFLDNFTSK